MKTAVLPIMLLTVFACAEEPAGKWPEPLRWEKTDVQLAEAKWAGFTQVTGNEMYVQLLHKLVAIDTTMTMRTVRTSDTEARSVPSPVFANGIYCVSELTKHFVQGRMADTLRIHFTDLKSLVSTSINLTKLRAELGLSHNPGWDAETIAIDPEGKVLISVRDFGNDVDKRYEISYQLQRVGAKIELIDRRLSEAKPPAGEEPENRFGRLLGFHNGAAYFTGTGASNCESSVSYSYDLQSMSNVVIFNDDTECFTRLGVLNGYLYSFDQLGTLHRIKL